MKTKRKTRNYHVPKGDKPISVRCLFYRANREVFECMLPIEDCEAHWQPIVVNGVIVREELFIDKGYITLQDKQKRYVARGIPPLVYKGTGVFPIEKFTKSSKVVKP